jgi:uncharacterized protein YdbL (DUF1318 family)
MRMMNTLFLIFALALAALGPATAMAGPLEDAKAAGLVGERPDGYVGLVTGNPPADVIDLVNQINAKRMAAYTDIATSNGTSVAAVGAVTAEKVYREAAPGTFLMVDGRWVRK